MHRERSPARTWRAPELPPVRAIPEAWLVTLKPKPLRMAIQTLFGTVPTEPDLLEKLKAGIQKTRSGFVDRLEDVLSGRPEINAGLLEELEYTLITADLGVATVEDIVARMQTRADRRQIDEP